MPRYHNEDYDIEKAFRAVEDELIASMMRNMENHRAEELEEGFEWEQWQVKQLEALERYKRANKRKFAGKFSNINCMIKAMIQEARAEGGMSQEIKILRAMQRGYQPNFIPEHMQQFFDKYKGKNLKEILELAMKRNVRTTTSGEFFDLNTRKLEALIRATQNDLTRAEHAMLRMANDKYRKIIFNAEVYANMGAGTYEKAVDMAAKDFLAAGINCIEYRNGSRHKIEDYADMVIRTATKRAYLTGEGEKRREWGISTVIMNKRGNPCPKCLPFCGKVLIDDVWSGGKRSDGPYPLMSRAMELGLYHPRCKDSHTTYFDGISTPGADYTEEELAKIGADYKAEQEQRYAQRQVQKFTTLATYSLDTANKKMYRARKEEWKKKAEEQHMAHAMIGNERVHFNPEMDYDIRVPEYSEEVNNALSMAARKVAEAGSGSGYEYSALVDLLTGEMVDFGTDGDKDSVAHFFKYLRGHRGGRYAVIHNHNTHSEMSFPDVALMANTKEIEVVASVTNDGIINVVVSNGEKTTKYMPIYYEKQKADYLKNHPGYDENRYADRVALEIYLRDLAIEEFGKGGLRKYG